MRQFVHSRADVVLVSHVIRSVKDDLRATRGGAADPRGHVAFVAVSAVSAGLLFVLLIAMSGVAALVLEECRG